LEVVSTLDMDSKPLSQHFPAFITDVEDSDSSAQKYL
jgi:hypothetical protein